MNGRRGFTLVELIMGLIVMGLVASVLARVFITQQRLTVAQVEQASMQANVRTGTLIMANELREVATNTDALGGIDIKSFSATSLTYRAMRSLALACGATNSPSPRVYIRATPVFGARPITPGRDSMLLFVENDQGNPDDDQWENLPISSIASSTCPFDGEPAFRINTTMLPAGVRTPDAPVRTFEIMHISTVLAGGHNWLAAHSLTDPAAPPLTPVAGPITLAGLTFAYLDANGTPTGFRNNIRSIRITLRGQSDWDVRPGSAIGVPLQPLLDSLVTTVTLRNAQQP